MKKWQFVLWLLLIAALIAGATYVRWLAFHRIHPDAPLWTFIFQ